MIENIRLRFAALLALFWGPPLLLLLMAIFVVVGLREIAYLVFTGRPADA